MRTRQTHHNAEKPFHEKDTCIIGHINHRNNCNKQGIKRLQALQIHRSPSKHINDINTCISRPETLLVLVQDRQSPTPTNRSLFGLASLFTCNLHCHHQRQSASESPTLRPPSNRFSLGAHNSIDPLFSWRLRAVLGTWARPTFIRYSYLHCADNGQTRVVSALHFHLISFVRHVLVSYCPFSYFICASRLEPASRVSRITAAPMLADAGEIRINRLESTPFTRLLCN
ncbi:hypothetical protein F4818DRAFT_113555 [Hypoxylon cercidicola]|nr:hypothetical protein F4818DRAFT_113555 [Hypoxylon cercidicola]